jgi:hypothetical protein
MMRLPAFWCLVRFDLAPTSGLAIVGRAATPTGLRWALRLRLLGGHGVHQNRVHVAVCGQLVESVIDSSARCPLHSHGWMTSMET